MKKIPLVILALFILSGCTKSNNVPELSLNESPDTAKAVVVLSGSFINGPYGEVAGQTAIYNEGGHFSVSLQGFTTSNGPDLHVYLSQETQPVHFIELGKLKSTRGNQVYEVPGQPDLKQYGYVLIHCQQYNHVFGIASLK